MLIQPPLICWQFLAHAQNPPKVIHNWQSSFHFFFSEKNCLLKNERKSIGKCLKTKAKEQMVLNQISVSFCVFLLLDACDISKISGPNGAKLVLLMTSHLSFKSIEEINRSIYQEFWLILVKRGISIACISLPFNPNMDLGGFSDWIYVFCKRMIWAALE